ncbi:MAG TPA: sodium transporter, partial [Pricia sp.]|nr:sodium transporter [Pricia sp.]
MRKISHFPITALLLLLALVSTGQEIQKVGMEPLPALPATANDSVSFGYAGMMGGAHNGAILAAGGANFPNGLPWQDGEKVYSNAIYVLDDGQWSVSNQILPAPLAYG